MDVWPVDDVGPAAWLSTALDVDQRGTVGEVVPGSFLLSSRSEWMTTSTLQVWLQHGRGWTMLPGPDGTLQAARLGYNEKWTGWVVTDGRLWYGDLSAVLDALG
jgi:hypothetical protein